MTRHALLTLFTLCALTTPAYAQNEEAVTGIFSLGSSLVYSTSIGLPLTTVAGGVVLTVVLVTRQSSAELQHYLQHNRGAVQAALHLPDARQEATADLAAMFGISQENSNDFATLLYESRATLSAQLTQEPITPEASYRFGRHIVEKMQQHPTLSLDVQRQLDQAHAAR